MGLLQLTYGRIDANYNVGTSPEEEEIIKNGGTGQFALTSQSPNTGSFDKYEWPS
jgi:hypothetical protein